ncbi:MAG: DUF4097 family beta strand repeat protein [Deltaproteobacteria bacterium]|nr:DUF4097 family beta strand repeat protein [Deltaproteobacteria bacterium]MBW2422228.1 DUF4097 family beta strand repeat protein [Deltaproteobacteria bacterium]
MTLGLFGEEDEDRSTRNTGRLGGLLRSLMAGIPWSESAEEEELLELPVPRGAAVLIHNANGRSNIVGEERENIEIRAHKSSRAESKAAAQSMIDEMKLHNRWSGDHLELDVDIPKKWNRHGRVNLSIRIPTDMRVEVTSANGRMCLEGIRGTVRARSSNGSVSVRDVIGDVQVITANAKVRCSNTCGRLVARSSNGKIELGDHCGSVDASTSNGMIRAALKEISREGVRLATSNGRIILELPEEANGDVDIRVENGVIRNSRELSGENVASGGHVRGRLGRGGPPIKLRTSNGTVSVR